MADDQVVSELISEAPALDTDPFSDDVLRDPYPFFAELRDAAPAVYLTAHDVYAVGRYNEASIVATDYARFTSAAGMGMADIRKPGAWRTPSPISEIDPPSHTQVRRVLNNILSPAVLRTWRTSFEEEADRLVEEISGRDILDGVKDLAEAYVLSVFPKALGVSVPPENLVKIGDMNFNQLGPNNERTKKAVKEAEPILPWYEESFQRRSMLPGGFGERIFLAEDAGDLPEGTATSHVRGFLRGGVDTTIAGIGFMLRELARDPQRWEAVRLDQAKVRIAFDEALRLESPAQVLFRTTVSELELSGVRLEADKKIGYFIGSANRDPRKWETPEKFDLNRASAGVHLALGRGPHVCIGQMIARLESECLLSALARRVKRIELAGEPRHRLVNTLRTLGSLPLRVHW